VSGDVVFPEVYDQVPRDPKQERDDYHFGADIVSTGTKSLSDAPFIVNTFGLAPAPNSSLTPPTFLFFVPASATL
jgi:hypothetical protein